MAENDSLNNLALNLSKQYAANLEIFHEATEPYFNWLREKVEEAKNMIKDETEFILPKTPARKRKLRSTAVISKPILQDKPEICKTRTRSSRRQISKSNDDPSSIPEISEKPAKKTRASRKILPNDAFSSVRVTRTSVLRSRASVSMDNQQKDIHKPVLSNDLDSQDDIHNNVSKMEIENNPYPNQNCNSSQSPINDYVNEQVFNLNCHEAKRGTFAIEKDDEEDIRAQINDINNESVNSTSENVLKRSVSNSEITNENTETKEPDFSKVAKELENQLKENTDAHESFVESYQCQDCTFDVVDDNIVSTSSVELDYRNDDVENHTPSEEIVKDIKPQDGTVTINMHSGTPDDNGENIENFTRCIKSTTHVEPQNCTFDVKDENKMANFPPDVTDIATEEIQTLTPVGKNIRNKIIQLTSASSSRKSLTQRRSSVTKMMKRNAGKNAKQAYKKTVEQNSCKDLQLLDTIKNSSEFCDQANQELVILATPSPIRKPLRKKKLNSQASSKLTRSHSAIFNRVNPLIGCKTASKLSSTKKSMKRLTSEAISLEKLEEKRLEELMQKNKQHEEKMKRKEEILKKKIEEAKKKREERVQRVMKQKRIKEQESFKIKAEIENRLETINQKERDREERRKKNALERKMKKKLKLEEVEARRKLEEEIRLAKLKEQEENQNRIANNHRKKLELEEIDRQQKLAEAKKLQETKIMMQKEREKILQQHRLEMQQKDEELKQKKLEMERMKNAEKAAREKMEKEKMILKEKLMRERQEKELQEKEKILAKEKQKQDSLKMKVLENISDSLNKNGSKIGDYDKQTSGEGKAESSKRPAETYEMTPPPKKIPTKENYDITNLKSDDETDDECCPKKQLPEWACGHKLKFALIQQEYANTDTEAIFELIRSPDLCKIFNTVKQRYLKRTSSAIWDSPLLKGHKPHD